MTFAELMASADEHRKATLRSMYANALGLQRRRRIHGVDDATWRAIWEAAGAEADRPKSEWPT